MSHGHGNENEDSLMESNTSTLSPTLLGDYVMNNGRHQKMAHGQCDNPKLYSHQNAWLLPFLVSIYFGLPDTSNNLALQRDMPFSTKPLTIVVIVALSLYAFAAHKRDIPVPVEMVFFVAISLFSLGIGVWNANNYAELNTDIGHLIPGFGFIVFGFQNLLYSIRPDLWGRHTLTYTESSMWVLWGCIFITYYTIMSKGAAFKGVFSDQEHMSQALVYVAFGSMGMIPKVREKMGNFPMVAICFSMFIFLSNHVQACVTLSRAHAASGLMFSLGGVFRLMNQHAQASWCIVMAGGIFMFSSNGLVNWASMNVEAASYIFSVMSFFSAWWSVWFVSISNRAENDAENNGNGQVHHRDLSMDPNDDTEAMMNGQKQQSIALPA